MGFDEKLLRGAKEQWQPPLGTRRLLALFAIALLAISLAENKVLAKGTSEHDDNVYRVSKGGQGSLKSYPTRNRNATKPSRPAVGKGGGANQLAATSGQEGPREPCLLATRGYEWRRRSGCHDLSRAARNGGDRHERGE
ncbi:hypothetical protein E2562_036105 [Oryza meyeriana var. granulata]|uniref:Uncharacterized protein n=1 Tax=Oryza meyeriana var. granulata TaxID=110450 RepID=A0A6G1DSB7_9ORYZ|nr:hypothetical protein E2562_036105 [Oryza meyeriana var. granulata]